MERYYFLRVDLDALTEKIQKLGARLRELGQEMGESTRQSAETFHDNFPYEEALRQFQMTNRRLHELMKVRACAQMVEPSLADRVGIGKRVTVETVESGEVRTFQVGSYLTLTDGKAVSYNAPLAKALIGARVGDIREGMITGKKKMLRVIGLA